MTRDVFELGYRYVLPSIRRMLVISLKERGITQMKIAQMLGITQSAVSKYLNMKRGSLIDLWRYDDIRTEVNRLAEEVIRGMSDEELSIKMMVLALKSMAKGYVCEFHSKIDPTVNPSSCGVCNKLFQQLVNVS